MRRATRLWTLAAVWPVFFVPMTASAGDGEGSADPAEPGEASSDSSDPSPGKTEPPPDKADSPADQAEATPATVVEAPAVEAPAVDVEPEETALAAEAPVDDGGDEFWDSDVVDRAIQVSGALMGSARLTVYPSDPDGLGENDLKFQLEHTHIKIAGDLTKALSYEVMPCLTHMDSFSVMTAFFSYEVHSAFKVTAGRFLLPFGGFNESSLPGNYATVSKPLLYQSHEDRTVTFQHGSPRSLFFTSRDDIGVKLSGSAWLGPADQLQLSYVAYMVNGPRPDSDTMARHWIDNNNAKALGGRVIASLDLGRFDIALGGSVLVNSYRDQTEETLWGDPDQLMWSADLEMGLRWAAGRRLAIHAEYTDSHQEIVPTDTLAAGDSTTRGWYVSADSMLTNWLGLFFMYDHLENRIPQALLNEQFRDGVLKTDRVLGGLTFAPASGLQVRLEYSYWIPGTGLPAAHRVSLQSVVTF